MRLLRIRVAAALFIISVGSAIAQSTEVPFGGLQQDPTLPVEISADNLKISQNDGTATFLGNVLVGQGEMRLSAAKVIVEYGPAEGENAGKISLILASGGVTLISGAEAAEAREAEYSIDGGVVVMTGNVILTQGANALSSDKMTINLVSGVANLEGRVRSIFKTGEN